MKFPQARPALRVWPLQDSLRLRAQDQPKNTVEISKIQLIRKLLNVESHPLAGPALRIWP